MQREMSNFHAVRTIINENSIFRASLKMVHDVLGHGAVAAAVLFTGGPCECVLGARACDACAS